MCAPYWAHERGLLSENHVVKHYQLKHFHLLGQRVKTPFAEVDLLFRAPQGHLLMVEVKTTNLMDFQPFRVSQKQKARLLRAMQFLAARWDVLVEIHWAFVTKEGEITVFEDISG
nr:hypothetical protein HAGR004_20040 [Bdellovibrio sp. HAGR004]